MSIQTDRINRVKKLKEYFDKEQLIRLFERDRTSFAMRIFMALIALVFFCIFGLVIHNDITNENSYIILIPAIIGIVLTMIILFKASNRNINAHSYLAGYSNGVSDLLENILEVKDMFSDVSIENLNNMREIMRNSVPYVSKKAISMGFLKYDLENSQNNSKNIKDCDLCEEVPVEDITADETL
eukprot:TRINITY_DN4607_c0_g1_i1.p1 TRINITY_DN4607_c0_g1~~TRINITY_DN4607_c0_g1_i1.p1  ORF type:complete len:193 (+),score=45.52 TRINITY_DN4607_c0_g1_i1:29-580(+)